MSWASKPVLVTGGTGFIGGFVARDLAARGLQPRLFDLRPDAARLDAVAPGLPERCELVAGDVADPEAVAQAMAGCATVIHLAGLMTLDCRDDPLRAARVNLMGGQAVIAAAVASGVARLAYVSSAAVYGAGDGRAVRPETLYGVHKRALEGMARCTWIEHGLPSAGFRPAIVYGFGESSGIAGDPSRAIRAVAEGRPAKIRFSGRAGFVHVEDVSRALVSALFEASDGATVHDLNGTAAKVTEVAQLLAEACPQAQVTVEGTPLKIPEILLGGEVPDWFATLPVTPLQSGISRTFDHWSRLARGGAAHGCATGPSGQ